MKNSMKDYYSLMLGRSYRHKFCTHRSHKLVDIALCSSDDELYFVDDVTVVTYNKQYVKKELIRCDLFLRMFLKGKFISYEN